MYIGAGRGRLRKRRDCFVFQHITYMLYDGKEESEYFIQDGFYFFALMNLRRVGFFFQMPSLFSLARYWQALNNRVYLISPPGE